MPESDFSSVSRLGLPRFGFSWTQTSVLPRAISAFKSLKKKLKREQIIVIYVRVVRPGAGIQGLRVGDESFFRGERALVLAALLVFLVPFFRT